MTKRTFSVAERIAIWLEWDRVCPLCEGPLPSLLDVTVDHILPETLEGKPTELKQAIEQYGLPADFQINDFPNWVPAHSKCNSRKDDEIFAGALAMTAFLRRAKRIGEKARSRHEMLRKQASLAKLLAKLDANLHDAKPDPNTMWLLRHVVTTAESLATDDTRLRIDPNLWRITRVNVAGIADVTDGQNTGVTALHGAIVSDMDSWCCKQCKGYGPFSIPELKCLGCGYDPTDRIRKLLDTS